MQVWGFSDLLKSTLCTETLGITGEKVSTVLIDTTLAQFGHQGELIGKFNAVLKQWEENAEAGQDTGDDYPYTWGGLIELLQTNESNALAAEIIKVLEAPDSGLW